LIISVLQNHSRSFPSFLSADISDFTHENTENRCFSALLQNESRLYWQLNPLFLSILRSFASNNNPVFTKRIGQSLLTTSVPSPLMGEG
jgi:hypothetical protein